MFKKVIRFFASLKLAVLIIAVLAVLISAGTVVESRYDAWTAKNWVYNSVWMYLTLGMLTLSLIAVIVDRWPWKIHHSAFIFAHIGIIIIIYGSLLTQLFGVDGTIRLTRSPEPVKEVTVSDTELVIYRSRDGNDYEQVSTEPVNFIKSPIVPGKPFLIKAKDLNFEIISSVPYALPQEKIEASSNSQSGAALRFQISNANVNQVDWLVQRNPFERVDKQLGPLLITMGGLWERTAGINEIRLFQGENGKMNYWLFNKNDSAPKEKGLIAEGQVIDTGWMGLEFRALRYLPKAAQRYDVKILETPTPLTVQALQVRYNGIESYLVLNDYVKIFTDSWVYLVAFRNKRLPLDFGISLAQFQKTAYPGTTRAMAYQSEVLYDGGTKALISMNEPLKHKGFYLYQASFEEGPNGTALASILSVNRDPGRSWKYFGSLLMTVGIIMMFYFKKHLAKKKAD
ncbi:MAG: cytochrome c biogenesis protein ResB [Bdellovibrio sp.]|nr:cytochrome c biogenesis protein ResB [Bdellovibrio sp.]